MTEQIPQDTQRYYTELDGEYRHNCETDTHCVTDVLLVYMYYYQWLQTLILNVYDNVCFVCELLLQKS